MDFYLIENIRHLHFKNPSVRAKYQKRKRRDGKQKKISIYSENNTKYTDTVHGQFRRMWSIFELLCLKGY
jgi:hypothetical protein